MTQVKDADRRGRPPGNSGTELFAIAREQFMDQGYDALRPHTLALRDSTDIDADLYRLATMLQAGILSTAVLQMRTLVAAQADSFPDVARDYVARSWDRNIDLLAETLGTLSERGVLTPGHPHLAAEQFVWLAIGAPLNRLSLCGSKNGDSGSRLQLTAAEAVATFLSRYRPGSAAAAP
jgi:TetR/AcrR family transcriptional repressor of mexJK operon